MLKAKYTDPIVWTNVFFLLVSFITMNLFVILSAVMLTVGSTLMHLEYTYHRKLIDWSGMYVYPMMISFWLMIGDSPIMLYLFMCTTIVIYIFIEDLSDNNLGIGLVMVIACIVKMSLSPLFGIFASLTFLFYVYINSLEVNCMHLKQEDKAIALHTTKHVIASLGYALLML